MFRPTRVLLSFFFTVIIHQTSAALTYGPSTEVKYPGKFYWSLIADTDNSYNAGMVKLEREVELTVKVDRTAVETHVKNILQSASSAASVGGVWKAVSIQVDGSYETTVAQAFSKTSEYHLVESTVIKEKNSWECSGGSKMRVFQLIFEAPGMKQHLNIFNTKTGDLPDPTEKEIPQVRCNVRPLKYLQDLQVVSVRLPTSKPSNYLAEIDGKSADINYNFGGRYIYLVPKWTTNPKDAVTGLDIEIQKERHPVLRDLSEGAGGDNRYLLVHKNSESNQAITDLTLLRSATNRKPSERGWQYWTIDINKGRGGDYLFVAWKLSDRQ